MSQLLLATDLDETLIGDDEALRSLNNYLIELRKDNRLKLAYITGRSPQLYKELAEAKELLVPDALISAVGAEIYWNAESPADDWPQVSRWDVRSIQRALADINCLIPQPSSE